MKKIARPKSLAYRVVARIIRTWMFAWTKRDWRGGEHIPQTGGVILVANHASNIDPLTVAHYIYDHGRPPIILAKDSLFRVPVLGLALRSTGMIPVYRGTSRAGDSLVAARQGLEDGQAIMIFPEGTLTTDPDLWPMQARSGAARLALSTQTPVIPIAQWGAHKMFPRGAKLPKFGRKTVTVLAGPPVQLSDLYDSKLTRDVLQEASQRITARITAQLAEIRQEVPPQLGGGTHESATD